MAEKQIPDKIKNSIDNVLLLMESDDLPQAYSKVMFPQDGKPASAWSVSNRLICAVDWIFDNKPEIKKIKSRQERSVFLLKHLNEAIEKMDFRGYRQWKKVDRQVQKGSSASYILAPMMRSFNRFYVDGKRVHYDKNTQNFYNIDKEGNADRSKIADKDKVKTEKVQYVAGFNGIPVFDIKDTKGKSVKYKKLKLPELPYQEVAEYLNIDVKPISGNKRGMYGSYIPAYKRIELATPDQSTFFHELAHAVDEYIMKNKGRKLKGGQQIDQEIVAQMSAATIAYMRGYKVKETAAYTKRYVEAYGGKDKEKWIIKLTSRIEGIVDFITNFKSAKSPSRQMEEKTGEPKQTAEKLADDAGKTYEQRVQELEGEGMTRSDAQGVADAEQIRKSQR